MPPGITQRPFGYFENKAVTEYTITNANGMQVAAIGYGATITRIITPDKDGNSANIILGFDSLDGYLQNGNYYMGAVVGRYCNRIANACFFLDGQEYKLEANHKSNNLHGGIKGFDKVIWNIEIKDDQSLKLNYLSKDGEEGFPGNLTVEVIYTLTATNELIIEYTASTDRATPVNLTSHCYFNLQGEVKNILDHELKLFADRFTMLNSNAIPTGELLTVKNDRLDFTTVKKIGKDIDHFPGGYDINFVLNSSSEKAAALFDPASGRFMEMFTTEPGLQLYVGDFDYPGNITVKNAAVCLEAQHFPNSPNEPTFPNTILRPGEMYRQTTTYKFSLK